MSLQCFFGFFAVSGFCEPRLRGGLAAHGDGAVRGHECADLDRALRLHGGPGAGELGGWRSGANASRWEEDRRAAAARLRDLRATDRPVGLRSCPRRWLQGEARCWRQPEAAPNGDLGVTTWPVGFVDHPRPPAVLRADGRHLPTGHGRPAKTPERRVTAPSATSTWPTCWGRAVGTWPSGFVLHRAARLPRHAPPDGCAQRAVGAGGS